MFKLLPLTSILLFLFMTGCSSWNAEKCKSTNWDSQGYSDGASGKGNSAGVYASRCQKVGASISGQAYNKGYDRGLKSFCNYSKGQQTAFTGEAKLPLCAGTTDYNSGYAKGVADFCTSTNGYKVGLDGGEPAKICSGQSLTNFMSGFNKGRKKFVYIEIDNIKSDVKKAQSDLDSVRDKIADKQYALNRIPKYTNEPEVQRMRQEAENDLNGLMNDRDTIKKQVDDMNDRIRDLEREIRSF